MSIVQEALPQEQEGGGFQGEDDVGCGGLKSMSQFSTYIEAGVLEHLRDSRSGSAVGRRVTETKDWQTNSCVRKSFTQQELS